MLTDGIDHIALSTADLDHFVTFLVRNFDAVEERRVEVGETQNMSVVKIGPHTEFNVFGPRTAGEAPWTLDRGRLDHFGVRAANLSAFEEIRRRLMESEATDGYVSDFGPTLSMFFRGPDDLEGEVLVANPSPQHAHYGPGRQSDRYTTKDGAQ